MELSKYFDHTLLKADATRKQIEELCLQAKDNNFASVCVNSYWVKECKKQLQGTDVKVCTVVGFPLGAMSSEAKSFETTRAIIDGADEIDMVINIGEAKDHNYTVVENDIKAVVNAAQDKIVKVIIECCLLTDEEKSEVCKASVRAGAKFVKTSTGFSTSGATVEDVKLMQKAVEGKCLIKAAGGIRDYATAKAMIDAGADRLGCSQGMKILQEAKNQ